MVDSSFGSKLKKLKSKTKQTSKTKSKYVHYIKIILAIMAISFVSYKIYDYKIKEISQETKELEEAKISAINKIKQMFSKYPGDPQSAIFTNKIKNCESIDEVNQILNELQEYITLKTHKDDVINDIKNTYGSYYEDNPYVKTLINEIKSAKSIDEVNKIANELHDYMALKAYKDDVINDIKNTYGLYYEDNHYAKTLVNKIKSAKSIDEVDNIIKNANIEENAKRYYINKIENSVAFNRYYAVPIHGSEKLMSGEELLNYVKKLSLTDIKNLNITPVSFNKVAIVVSGTQCGKIPHEGSKIEIYNKNDVSMKPILGIINSSYVIIKDMEYSESKNVKNTLSEDEYTTSVSSTSSTSYSLNNIPGILYATAADRLDYNAIKDKFGRYGEKLNKIQEDTQIFDENAKYLLVLSVPSDSIPNIISMKDDDIYIVSVE